MRLLMVGIALLTGAATAPAAFPASSGEFVTGLEQILKPQLPSPGFSDEASRTFGLPIPNQPHLYVSLSDDEEDPALLGLRSGLPSLANQNRPVAKGWDGVPRELYNANPIPQEGSSWIDYLPPLPSGPLCTLTADTSLRWLGYLRIDPDQEDIYRWHREASLLIKEPVTLKAGEEVSDALPAKSLALRKLLYCKRDNGCEWKPGWRFSWGRGDEPISPPPLPYCLTVDAELPWLAAISWGWGQIQQSVNAAEDGPKMAAASWFVPRSDYPIKKTARRPVLCSWWTHINPEHFNSRGYMPEGPIEWVLTVEAYLLEMGFSNSAQVYRCISGRPDIIKGSSHFLLGHGVGSNGHLGEKHPAPYQWAEVDPSYHAPLLLRYQHIPNNKLAIDGNLNWLSALKPDVWWLIRRQIGACVCSRND